MGERCWQSSDPLYDVYHDEEWGRPVVDERGLYERFCLEGFQSGLSWLTILRKREGFRAAFAGFDPERVARFGERDVKRLLGDAAIVRHRGKIEATIANAQATLALRDTGTPLPALVWSHRPEKHRAPRSHADWPTADARVGGAVEGAAQGRLPLRRADDRLRGDAGVRGRQRPPGDVPCPEGRRARPRRCAPPRLSPAHEPRRWHRFVTDRVTDTCAVRD